MGIKFVILFYFFIFLTLNEFVNISILQPKEGASDDGANKSLNSYNNASIITTNSDCEEENVTQISNVVHKRT